MNVHKWSIGDWAIYRKQKRSTSPGPRAESMHPDEHGEEYTYIVEKYWVVEEILESGELQLITRRGKRHVVSPDDPRLLKPGIFKRWALGSRFREVEKTLQAEAS